MWIKSGTGSAQKRLFKVFLCTSVTSSGHVGRLVIENVDILNKQYIWIKYNVNIILIFRGLAALQVFRYEILLEYYYVSNCYSYVFFTDHAQ